MIKVAVAGSGYFSQFHFDAWRRLEGAELVGAASLDADSLSVMKKRFNIEATFADVGEMLDKTEPDLLDIVAPPAAHRAILEEAARRGVNIICQKPLGGDLQTAKEMVTIAETTGVTLVVHENFRFQPWYREAKRLMAEGFLGEITNISFRLRPGDGQGPSAYLDRQPYFQTMERFLVHETAIHIIDSFRFLMGDVETVYADLKQLNPVIKGEDAGYLVFNFTSGARGLFDGNRLLDSSARDPRLTMGEMLIEGTGGSLKLDGDANLWRRDFGGLEAPHPYSWSHAGFGGDCVHALQKHVVDHFLHDTPIENTGKDYLANLEIEEAIYRSAEAGRLETLAS
ncbi:MAG: Gfo/Idh/MocA family protein [Geminicoccales bacterium]